MPRPNFFIIGSYKAGTTSLYHYLKGHPQVFMAALKEPHYFVPHRRMRPQVVASEKAYLALFRDAGEAKVIGEASAYYFATPESAALVHGFAPEAKILLCLRHPAEVAYAFYYEQRFLGRERRPFNEVWNEYAAVIEQWPQRITQWRGLFGERVKIVIFDDLMRDPAALLDEIIDFLGVSKGYVPLFIAHNPAKALMQWWRARLQASGVVVAGMRMVYRLPTLAVWVDGLRKQRVVYSPRPAMDAQLWQALVARLVPTVEVLEAYLGRELDAWKR